MPHSIDKSRSTSLVARSCFPHAIWPVLGVMFMAACDQAGDPLSPNQRVARLEKVSVDSQVFDFGTRVSLTHSVRVLDAKGKPVEGVSVFFSAYEFFTGYRADSVISNSAGIATVPEWKPSSLGRQYLSMWAEGSNTVKFLATMVCVTNQSIELGVPVSGTLAAGDCSSYCDACSGAFEDHFSFVTASALTVKMNVTGSKGSYTSVRLLDAETRTLARTWIRDESIEGYDPIWVIIPPGSYDVAVLGEFESGSYEVAIDGPVTDPGCNVLFIVRGATTSQDLESLDCVDQSRYVDSFYVVLHPGQTVTVSLASPEFDSVLELEHTGYYDYTAPPPVTRTTGTPGVPARLSGSCNHDDCIFRILATSRTTLTTGAYTLSVLP